MVLITKIINITTLKNRGNIMLKELDFIQEIDKILSSPDFLGYLLAVLFLLCIIWMVAIMLGPGGNSHNLYKIKK